MSLENANIFSYSTSSKTNLNQSIEVSIENDNQVYLSVLTFEYGRPYTRVYVHVTIEELRLLSQMFRDAANAYEDILNDLALEGDTSKESK